MTSLDQNSAFDYALDVVALTRAIEALERVRELEAENASLRDQLQAQANEAAGLVERLAAPNWGDSR